MHHPTHARFEPAFRQRSRRAVFLVLSVCLASLCGVWVSGFAPHPRWAQWPDDPRAPAPPSSPGNPPTAPNRVVQPHPFGTDSSIAKAPRRLVLTTTRPGRNALEGHADLGTSALSPQTYRAGALLANGARLAEIYDDHVILERGGRRATLYVEGRAYGDAREAAAPRAAADPLLDVGGAPFSAPAVADSHDDLTDYIRVTPVYEGDALHALEVYANPRSDVFPRLGLEPGDRITAIDGEPVADRQSGFSALRRLSAGAALLVTIEREGTTRTLSLDGATVMAQRRAQGGAQGSSP
jgi:Type II secretion system protein C/PDZ domain